MALKMNTTDIDPMLISTDEIKTSPPAEEELLELEDGEIDDSDESNPEINLKIQSQNKNDSEGSQESRHKKSSHKKKKKSKRHTSDDKLMKHKKRKNDGNESGSPNIKKKKKSKHRKRDRSSKKKSDLHPRPSGNSELHDENLSNGGDTKRNHDSDSGSCYSDYGNFEETSKFKNGNTDNKNIDFDKFQSGRVYDDLEYSESEGYHNNHRGSSFYSPDKADGYSYGGNYSDDVDEAYKCGNDSSTFDRTTNNRGNNCNYPHELPEEFEGIFLKYCRNMLVHGQCMNENNCKFMHRDYPCMSYTVHGTCYVNERPCPFAHRNLSSPALYLVKYWKFQMSTIDDSKEIKYLKDEWGITPKAKPAQGENLLPDPTRQMLQLKFASPNIMQNPQEIKSPDSLHTPDNNAFDFTQSETSSGIKSLMELEVAPTIGMQNKINSNEVRTLNNPNPTEQELYDEEEIMCPPEDDFNGGSPIAMPALPPVFNNFNHVAPINNNDMMSPIRFRHIFSPPRPVIPAIIRPPQTNCWQEFNGANNQMVEPFLSPPRLPGIGMPMNGQIHKSPLNRPPLLLENDISSPFHPVHQASPQNANLGPGILGEFPSGNFGQNSIINENAKEDNLSTQNIQASFSQPSMSHVNFSCNRPRCPPIINFGFDSRHIRPQRNFIPIGIPQMFGENIRTMRPNNNFTPTKTRMPCLTGVPQTQPLRQPFHNSTENVCIKFRFPPPPLTRPFFNVNRTENVDIVTSGTKVDKQRESVKDISTSYCKTEQSSTLKDPRMRNSDEISKSDEANSSSDEKQETVASKLNPVQNILKMAIQSAKKQSADENMMSRVFSAIGCDGLQANDLKQCLIKAKSKHEVQSSMYKNKTKSEEVKDPRVKTSKSEKSSSRRHSSSESTSSSKYSIRVRDPTPLNELVKDPKKIPLHNQTNCDVELKDPRKSVGSLYYRDANSCFTAPVPKFKQVSLSKSSNSTTVSSSLSRSVITTISSQRDPRVRNKRNEITERKSPESNKVKIPAALLKKPPSMSIPKLSDFKMPEVNKDPRLNKKLPSIPLPRKRKVIAPTVPVAPKILKPTLTINNNSAVANTILPSLIEPSNKLSESAGSPKNTSDLSQIAPYDPRYIQNQLSLSDDIVKPNPPPLSPKPLPPSILKFSCSSPKQDAIKSSLSITPPVRTQPKIPPPSLTRPNKNIPRAPVLASSKNLQPPTLVPRSKSLAPPKLVLAPPKLTRATAIKK